MTSPASVLVLGIGNILLRDEGVGVRVIEAMRGRDLPDSVELMDGGTSGADLVDAIAGRRKVIVVDAMDADAAPGEVYRLTPEDLLHEANGSLSLHEFGFLDTWHMAVRLGCAPGEVVILAVQPKDTRTGLELSDDIAAVIDDVIQLVLEEACPEAPRRLE